MKRQIIATSDGSKTIHLPDWNESYHSKHGAVQEAKHVFIRSGLNQISHAPVQILEIGFGTGLNAILTLIEAKNSAVTVHYSALEAYPVTWDEIKALKYYELAEVSDYNSEYQQMHKTMWDIEEKITQSFQLKKIHSTMEDFYPEVEKFDLIYFDAFGPRVQPEMWTAEVFNKMFGCMTEEGILVTYCSKGQVRRDMIAAGFKVEKIPGPPGKREMLRAIKPKNNEL
ncbi:MAG: tRNA (5-methylaminomethyl-2-thiouridine)(34)-methyltransferase MnmD [Brumimicrobium sp.]|nr:tRNA (5-methylaminomethyl-2-thiouridine)(34)-methyltransferase MnmD [Brumimicrobium sp.]